MRATVGALAILVALSEMPAQADEAHDLAADIAARTNSNETFEKTFSLMRGAIVSDMARSSHKPTAELGRLYDEIVLPTVLEALPRIRTACATIYLETYDLADLRGLDAFYRSRVGEHLISHAPQVVEQVASAVGSLVRTQVEQAVRAHAAELRQRGVSL